MKDITFAVIGAGFMGRVLARIGHELPYARCVAAAFQQLELPLPRHFVAIQGQSRALLGATEIRGAGKTCRPMSGLSRTHRCRDQGLRRTVVLQRVCSWI